MKTAYILFFLSLFVLASTHTQEYQILFTKQINNSDNLFLIDMEGNIKPVTNHPRKDSSPMISPDGSHIVFTSERVGWWKIWLMDIKTNSFTQLTNASAAEYNPSWSPDGKQITFVSGRSGNSDLYVMNKSGKGLKRITKGKRTNTMSSWGSDGFIYYSTKINGTYQIAKILPDGSNNQIITKSKGDKYAPQLSNNQKQILYYGGNNNLDIYTLDLKSGATKRLTSNPLMDIRPKWSYDDKKIVFERGNKKNNQHIYIMDADGKNKKKLTSKNYNYTPSFLPNDIKLK